METVRIKKTWRSCPGGTPPIYFGGRDHCYSAPPGLNGSLSSSLGMPLGTFGVPTTSLFGMAVLAGLAGVAYAMWRPKRRK